MTHSRRVLVGVLVALAISGCGNSGGSDEAAPEASSPSSSATPSPSGSPGDSPGDRPSDGGPTADPDEPYVPGSPQNEVRPATAQERADWPACDEVWRDGGQVPARYRGCVDGDDAVVADRISCSFGGNMTTYDDRYYAVIGRVVNDAGRSLAASKAYLDDYRLCTG